jgi:hypothetical protein
VLDSKFGCFGQICNYGFYYQEIKEKKCDTSFMEQAVLAALWGDI